jgi:F-type H+-transporting ATPase subunit epsilon
MEVSILSPDRVLYTGDAQSITAPGTVGSFSILESHAPLVTTLEPGLIKINSADGEKHFVVRDGFLEVRNNKVTALLEAALLPDEINADDVQSQLDKLLKQQAVGDEAMKNKQNQLDYLRVQLRYAAQ